MRLAGGEAQVLDPRMGRTQLLDHHVDERLARFRLLPAHTRAPLVEFLVALQQQDYLSVIGDLLAKLRALSNVPIKLHPQEAVSRF